MQEITTTVNIYGTEKELEDIRNFLEIVRFTDKGKIRVGDAIREILQDAMKRKGIKK